MQVKFLKRLLLTCERSCCEFAFVVLGTLIFTAFPLCDIVHFLVVQIRRICLHFKMMMPISVNLTFRVFIVYVWWVGNGSSGKCNL